MISLKQTYRYPKFSVKMGFLLNEEKFVSEWNTLFLNENTFVPLILTYLISHVSTWLLLAHNQHSYPAVPASGLSWENPPLIPLSFLILMQICNFSHANFQMQIFQLLKYSGAHWLSTLVELMGSGEYLGNQKTLFVCASSFTAIVPIQNFPRFALQLADFWVYWTKR